MAELEKGKKEDPPPSVKARFLRFLVNCLSSLDRNQNGLIGLTFVCTINRRTATIADDVARRLFVLLQFTA